MITWWMVGALGLYADEAYLFFQVINGLMSRDDWEAAIQLPLSVLPGGSGNALASSINYYAG